MKVINRIVKLLEMILIIVWKNSWLSEEQIMEMIEDSKK
jgi:hypothetical protein